MEDLTPLNKSILESHSIKIQTNADSSIMQIDVTPEFSFIYIGLVAMSFLTILFFINPSVDEQVEWFILGLILWGILISSVVNLRKNVFLLNKTTGNIQHFRAGILNTGFDESNSNYSLANVTAVQMKRHVQRYGDTFQVCLLVREHQRVDVTLRNLNFSECQSNAEIIRDFIDSALPITAVD